MITISFMPEYGLNPEYKVKVRLTMRFYSKTVLLALLALLLLAGCGDPAAELEAPPLPLPTGKAVVFRDPGGKEWPLFKGVSLDQVMEIMRKAGPGSRQGAGEDWQGELVFTAPGGKEHYDLYAGCIRHCGLAYALDPDQIQLLRDCFEREILEIQGLVRIKDLDDSIIIDLKYATADNFTGQVIYPAAVGVIKRETGKRLVEAHKIFREKGLTIKVWDAYRPFSYQQRLWEAFPDPRYVIKPESTPPASGFRARHNNGMSVDITLVDETGRELEMPTGFDDFTESASPEAEGMSPEARANVDLLISVMRSAGFEVAPTEWWHFNDITGEPSPYLDVPLEAFLD